MSVATLTPLPPAEAIAALQRRGLRLDPTFSWQDAWEADHAKMFTVAKSAGFDILSDIHAALASAIAEGRTIRDFAADLRPVLEAKGWWGRKEVTDPLTGEVREAQLGSTRRLRTMFETNMRVSYAEGHWARFERGKSSRPYLRYVAILDGRTRPAHRARHNVCLPVDDPYWDRWAPPCGWGCRCTLQSLSQRDVDRMRGELRFTPPPDTIRSFVNSRTGEIVRVPDGIDPGWAYNPGKTGWQAATVADKLASAPAPLSAAAVADPRWPARALADEFATWFDQAAAGGRVGPSIWTIGAIDQATLDALAERGIRPQSGAITLTQSQAGHMVREAKAEAGKAVPLDLLRRLPETLATARAVLRDRRDDALVYVFDVPGDPRLGKLIVRVDFSEVTRPPGGKRRRIATNSIRTAGLVDSQYLDDTNFYEVLSGSL